MNKKEWVVEIEQNGGEYTGWVTFFAEEVLATANKKRLIVDGFIMEFDERVISVQLSKR